MLELQVIGKPEFTLGFQLAGIKRITTIEDGARDAIKNIDEEVGVVVLDKESFEELDEFEKQEVEDSIKPVFVVLSEEESDKSLRRMIKKSIGVDVWEKQES